MFTFVKASEHPKVFRNLFNAYLCELSAFNDNLHCNHEGLVAPEEGRALLTDEYENLLLLSGTEWAGFIVMRKNGLKGAEWHVEEIYIMPCWRHCGAAYVAMDYMLRGKSGKCSLHVLKQNNSGMAFWRNYILSRSGAYAIGVDGVRSFYMIFRI